MTNIMPHPLMHITPEDMRWAHDAAARFGVSDTLHREDFILHFLFNNPLFTERREAIEYYFFDGHRSSQKLTALLTEIGLDLSAEHNLLEFASGFGCVTRHLKNAMPKMDVTSCDIHPKAMDFIANNIGVKTQPSMSDPDRFSRAYRIENFDVVFALSFFSHMPERSWQRWLETLYGQIKPGGVLAFTTHGANSARNHFGNPDMPESGFWFAADSEQKDLDTAEYGQTIVSRDFVFKALDRLPNVKLEIASPAAWWTHQDLWVVSKAPG